MYRIITLVCAASATLAAPLAAKDSLGVYSNWAAFRDDSPARCYAIAKPERGADTGPFASIANWPAQNVRGQVHIRLSRSIGEDADVTLTIGDRRFELAANGRNAWAADTAMDAGVVAAMRSASRMSVSSRDSSGRRFTDRYDLTGAATAMDAAVVACASRS
nr:invasion associated locus B family protein [uncultured Erythrobacter sp.]